MLTLGYILALIVAIIVLRRYVRRLDRPRVAAAPAQAEGPWCAQCDHPIRVAGGTACPGCGRDLTKSGSLRLRVHGVTRPLLWQVPLVIVLCGTGWAGGAWLAIPESAHYRLVEHWEQPASGAYSGILLTGWNLGGLYWWQNYDGTDLRSGRVTIDLYGAPERPHSIHVAGPESEAYRDFDVQSFELEDLLDWFADAELDVTDPAVRAEAEHLHGRITDRLLGQDAAPDASRTPFAGVDVSESTGRGFRDGYFWTTVGLILTLPLYIVLAVLLIKAAARRSAPSAVLDPAVPVDFKRRRLLRPRS